MENEHHSKLCICVRALAKGASFSGISIPEIGDFRDIPRSFFAFQTIELNFSRVLVRERNSSNRSTPHEGGNCGKSLTSTELLPYSVVLR